jgi:o-succinylbenzoate synthase
VEIAVWQRDARLLGAVSAANQQHAVRHHLFVSVSDSDAVGWGEVAVGSVAVGSDPSFDVVATSLVREVVPACERFLTRTGQLPPWDQALDAVPRHGDARWAFAALEMALLDLALVRAGTTVAASWSVDPLSVGELTTCSLVGSDGGEPTPSAARVRVKVSGDVDVRVHRERLASWGKPLIVDCNESAPDEAFAHGVVSGLHGLPLVALEQPFPRGDLARTSELARTLAVPLSLDEEVRSVLSVQEIASHHAAQLLCVKPARVGGLVAARRLCEAAAHRHLRVYIGGLFESPLGRAANRALAAAVGAEPSDVGRVATDAHDTDAVRATGLGVLPDVDHLTPLEKRALG